MRLRAKFVAIALPFALLAASARADMFFCQLHGMPPDPLTATTYQCADTMASAGVGAPVVVQPDAVGPGAVASEQAAAGSGSLASVAAATAFAAPGLLRVRAEAQSLAPQPPPGGSFATAAGWADASFFESGTVVGKAGAKLGDPVEVRVIVDVNGSFFNLSSGASQARVIRNDTAAVVNFESTLFLGRPAEHMEYLANFQVGDKVTTWMTLHASAGATNEFDKLVNKTQIADLSNSGHLYFDVMSDNAEFVSASGHDYSFAAAVPEPTAYASLIAGLAVLLGMRRRARAGDEARGRCGFRIAMLAAALGLIAFGHAASAHEGDLVKPNLITRNVVSAMPTGAQQEIRVLTASFKPGDNTVTHTHRFPVTVYVLEGAFTLDLAGRAPVVVKAGEAFVEPPNVKMTGYNRGPGELRVVIFYASDVDTPFLDPAQ